MIFNIRHNILNTERVLGHFEFSKVKTLIPCKVNCVRMVLIVSEHQNPSVITYLIDMTPLSKLNHDKHNEISNKLLLSMSYLHLLTYTYFISSRPSTDASPHYR